MLLTDVTHPFGLGVAASQLYHSLFLFPRVDTQG
jgi:hypothetical protein